MMEVVFHWSMVAYYFYADFTFLKGLLNAHSLRGRDPDDPTTSRMVNGVLTYITIWNLVVQQLYFIICCRDHLRSDAPGSEKREAHRRTRQLILRSILFPTTCMVALIYWYMYWRSPILIFGDILSEIYPAWVDHSMHTFIVPIAFLELYLSTSRERVVDSGRVKGWLTLIAFLTIYATVVLFAHSIRGIWPYPFLDPVNNGSPSLFFITLCGGGGFWYYVGQHLTHKIWGSRYNARKIKHQYRNRLS